MIRNITIALVVIATSFFSYWFFSSKIIEFNLTTIENKTISSNQTKDKLTLINYWATWCPPCIREMPVFNQFQQTYPNEVLIIGINYERDNQQKVIKFIEDKKITYSIIMGYDNDLSAFGAISVLPTTIVLYNNRYIKTHTGELSNEDLEQLITDYKNDY